MASMTFFMINSTSSTATSRKFSSCTIPCNAFSRAVFLLHSSNVVFHEHSRYFIKSGTNGVRSSFYLKPAVGCFQTEQQKTKRNSEKEKLPLFTTNTQWHFCLHWSLAMIHRGWYIQSAPKLAAANLSQPSFSTTIFFNECPEHTAHFSDVCKVNKRNALFVVRAEGQWLLTVVG